MGFGEGGRADFATTPRDKHSALHYSPALLKLTVEMLTCLSMIKRNAYPKTESAQNHSPLFELTETSAALLFA